VERNTDGRSFKTIDGERVKVNFLIFYEIDQQTVKTVLRLHDYDSEWVLLASDAAVPIEPGPREAHTLADPGPAEHMDADMPIICGPILISSVSLPVAVLASAMCGIFCLRGPVLWLVSSYVATLFLLRAPARTAATGLQRARLPHSSALLRAPHDLAPCWFVSLTDACKSARFAFELLRPSGRACARDPPEQWLLRATGRAGDRRTHGHVTAHHVRRM
jgi:hypothetical protein